MDQLELSGLRIWKYALSRTSWIRYVYNLSGIFYGHTVCFKL